MVRRQRDPIFLAAAMFFVFGCGETTTSESATDGGSPTSSSGGAAGVGGAAGAGGAVGTSGAAGAGGMSGSANTGGQSGMGGAGGGRDAGVCSTVPTCSDTDAASCPSHHPHCIAGRCCQFSVEAPDCAECTCDSQCPSQTPFCESGRCTACLSKADCPPGMCCAVPFSGGPHACMTTNCVN